MASKPAQQLKGVAVRLTPIEVPLRPSAGGAPGPTYAMVSADGDHVSLKLTGDEAGDAEARMSPEQCRLLISALQRACQSADAPT
jgi:hypothetical protein